MSLSIGELSNQFSSLSIGSPKVVDPKVSSIWLQLIKSQCFTHVTGSVQDRLGHLGLTVNRRGKGMYLITYGNKPLSITVMHKSFQSDSIEEIPFQVTPNGFRSDSRSIVAENIEEFIAKLRPQFGVCMSDEARPELDRAFVTLYKMKDSRLQRLLNRTLPLSQLDPSEINRDRKFLEKVIAKGYTTSAARLHTDKNRYSNVLPYDETRVCIADKPDFYINASHVALSHQNYVLCQAPTADTVSDFWLAVIHTGSRLVVSLDSQEKYWDSQTTVVQLESQHEISEYITRRVFTTADTSMSITHLECRGWEDHRECSMELFTHILDVIDTYKQDATVPIWVHCRAGRGRSGTTVVAHNSRLMVWDLKRQGNSAETIFCNIRQEVALARMQREAVVEQSQLPMLYKVLIQEREKMLCPIT